MNWLTDSIREFIHRGDRLLLTLCLLASGFGMVLIYSATRYMNHSAGLRCMLIQAVGIVLGVFVYIAMSSVDIELFTEKSWKWLFLFGLFINLLLLTPLGIGADETGNNSWLSIPGFPVNLQPAELAKLTKGSAKGYTLQRYKGLGEMSSEQLWQTTMNPETRTMMQVSVEDAMAADEIMSLLMGDKVEPRKEFIEENAKLVTDLDI